MNRRSISLLALCLGLAAAALGTSAEPAHAALSCNFSITDASFGSVDLTANATYDTTATFTANCSGGSGNSVVRVCPNIGAGGGGSGTGDPRLMLSGGNQLSYNLYQDGSRTVVWGSYLWSFTSYTPPTIDITLDGSGNGSANRTIYARISAGQQALPPGSYSSIFGGGDTQIAYNSATAGTCAQIGTTNATSAPFTAGASYSATCTISATTLDFGTTGVLAAAVNGTSTLTTTCSATTPYNVGLNGGNAGASDPTQRKMSKAGEQVTYGLYRDSARNQAWGDTIGTNTASATGTGSGQTSTVYGRVPAQTTPSAGTYSDTIVATVTY